MRAFLLVLLLAALTWGLWQFVSSSQAKEETSDRPQSETGRFLPETQPAPFVPATEPKESPPPASPGPALRKAEGPLSSRGASLPEATELAALVLHGTAGDVARFVEGGRVSAGSDVARAALAFAEARAGRLQQASEHVDDVEGLEIHADERRLLTRMVGGGGGSGVDLTESTPLALAMSMALVERSAFDAVANRRYAEAARAFSKLLLREVEAPWPADRTLLRRWTDELGRAQEQHRWSPRGAWPHVEVEVEPGDSLTSIRKRLIDEQPSLVICTGEIERASGLSPGETLHPGEKLRVPTEPASVLVDLDARWMFYLFGSEVACAWEVAIGAPDSETTPGVYHAGEKQENPTWFPEGQQPVLFGDPKNPLGTRWVGWIPADSAGGRGLGFHGTREPDTIGEAVSDGCIRLRNEEVEELFRILPRGARITVRP